MSDFFGVTERKARVEHRCAESRCVRTGTIKPGTRYVVISWAYDGHGWSEKLCLRCHKAHQRVAEVYGPFYGDEDGPALGCLLDYLRERPESRKGRARREARYQALRVESEARIAARRVVAVARVRDAVAAVARAKEAELTALEERGGFFLCRTATSAAGTASGSTSPTRSTGSGQHVEAVAT